jgi:hypothetical protein
MTKTKLNKDIHKLLSKFLILLYNDLVNSGYQMLNILDNSVSDGGELFILSCQSN